MAKIENIRDLVYSQIEKPKKESVATAAPSYMSKLRNNNNRSAAAEFLGKKPEDRLRNTPVSLRKQIEQKTSFVNPDKQFATPTLLRKLSKNPEATVDVAKAHTVMTKAEITAEVMQAEAPSNTRSPQELVRATRQKSHSFSRTPRTIQNLMN